MTSKPRVLSTFGRIDICTWWRVLWPMNTLRQHGYKVDCCLYDAIPRVDLSQYDLIVTPRVNILPGNFFYTFLREAGRRGVKWLYESDDDLWSPEFTKRQVEIFGDSDDSRPERKRKAVAFDKLREYRLQSIRQCKGITVQSSVLADRLVSLTRAPVEVVPNMIDANYFLYHLQDAPRSIDGLTVGWTGGDRTQADLMDLAQAWHIVARMHPSVKFVVFGSPDLSLMSSVPTNQLVYIDFTQFPNYPSTLKNFDVACCVLPDAYWNRAKSPIKFYEASLAGAASVVSPTVYGTVVRDGQNALVARTVDEWVTCLDRLIRDAELRKTLVTNAQATVIEDHGIATGWPLWVTAWERLLTR